MQPRSLARIALALAVLLATPAYALSATWAPDTFSPDAEQAMLAQVNTYRELHGRSDLTLDVTLAAEARVRSQDMYDRDYLGHAIPPDGHTVFDDLRALGYCYAQAGEVIARNDYPDDQTLSVALDWWTGDPTFSITLLGPSTVIGVGAYKGDGRWGGGDTADHPDHLWTVVLGTPCSTPPTPGPTPAPTPGPTPAPTPGPTPAPTVRQTPPPTVTPVAPTDPDSRPGPSPAAKPSRTDAPAAMTAGPVTSPPSPFAVSPSPTGTATQASIPITLTYAPDPRPSPPPDLLMWATLVLCWITLVVVWRRLVAR